MAEQLDVSRRQFVVLAATCAAACACGGGAFAAPTSQPTEKVDIGTPADYASDGVFDKFIRKNKIIVYRENGHIYATTAICPHKGAMMTLKGGLPYCTKHSSAFDADGNATAGPAKKMSQTLDRFAISKDDQGHLIVEHEIQTGQVDRPRQLRCRELSRLKQADPITRRNKSSTSADTPAQRTGQTVPRP